MYSIIMWSNIQFMRSNPHNLNLYGSPVYAGLYLNLFCTAIICESISMTSFIYRTNSYKSLKSSTDKASKKLETMKIETPARISTKKPKTKKIDRVQTSLKESNRDLRFKFKFDDVAAFVLFIVFDLSKGKLFKLLFTSFGIITKMSHHGLQAMMRRIV